MSTRKRILPFAAAAFAALTTGSVLAQQGDADWPMYNGSYAGERYSTLNQINAKNVGSLVAVARYQLPETTSFQSGPVVVGGTLYLTTATSTYAVDARTAKLLWSQKYAPRTLALGTPVRGVAYGDGKVYRGTPDAHVLALDARTGAVVWDVAAARTDAGEYFTAAPIFWEGRIYIGTSGSDVGAVGHMLALDAKDGKTIWNFDVVPTTGPGADTWPRDSSKMRAGGGMYSSFALDPASATLYIPTGNPGPDFAGDYRPGANLFTCSVVALDARTGELRAYQQFTPHDVHDWDVAASPILFTSRGGRAMVAAASKNGYLYGLSRDLKTIAYRVPVTTIANTEAPITAKGTHFLPGTQGGTNWNGPAYAPPLNLLYVGSVDWGTTLKLGGPETLREHQPGKPFLGSANAFGDSDPKKRSGWLYAVDADSGQVRWKYHSPTPLVAAVTPTAGGLVFTGDFDGTLLAFDAATGKRLAAKKAGGPIGGGIVTYAVGGTQYVAVAAGMKNPIMKTDSGPAEVVIYALPAKAAAGTPRRTSRVTSPGAS